MRFAISVNTTGFNIHTAGVILMIVGAVAFLISLAFWNSWGGFGSVGNSTQARSRRTTVDGPGGTTTTTTEERSSV